MRFTDPSGEVVPVILVAALIGGAINLGVQIYQGNIGSFQDGVVAFGIGGMAGLAGALTGGATLSAAAGAGIVGASAGGGILGGVIAGASGGAIGGAIQGVGNAVYFQTGDALKAGGQGALWGLVGGAVMGGVSGGIAAKAGKPTPPSGWDWDEPAKFDIWTGKIVTKGGGIVGLTSVPAQLRRIGTLEGSTFYGFVDDPISAINNNIDDFIVSQTSRLYQKLGDKIGRASFLFLKENKGFWTQWML